MNSVFRATTSMLRALSLGFAFLTMAPAESVSFIPVTPQNTCLSNGSPLPEKLESIGWSWKPDSGNGGVFESNPDVWSETLMVEVGGLDPDKPYEVFGYFWADGYGLDHPASRSQRPAQFGISLATLHTFDGPDQPVRGHVCAWEATPDGKAGAAYGLKATIEEEQPLEGIGKLKLRQENARLVRARLGRLYADASGKLPVFFADYPYQKPGGPAWIDGVAVRRIEAEGPLEEGWKKGTWLHLAIRAGDKITIGRELQHGVDVNILDEEHLSPLFHAVVAGDESLVKKLLETGADPNRTGQSVSPLCAAVSLSSVGTVKLLLERGADVPLEVAKDWGTLSKELHPGYLHPVICALSAGSAPVLKMLLEKRPDIDLRKLVDMKSIELRKGIRLSPPNTRFLENAVDAENWAMAVYLIDKGYTDLGGQAPGSRLLLSCCVAGEPARPVMEGLLKLGVKAVDFTTQRTQHSEAYGDGREHDAKTGCMLPTDALSAAVWAGDMPLVQRFLPESRYAPLDYIHRLYMTAAYRRDAIMVAMIENQFHRIRPLRWKPKGPAEQNEAMRDEDLRVFMPRTTPPPAHADRPPGQYVLGVIASPGAKDPGEALSAIASTQDGWKVVDRDLVESAMVETRIGKPWLDGNHQLAPLGDKLSADVLAIVDVIKGARESVYSIETVEVATGLVVHREHFSNKSFKPDEDVPALLRRSACALDATRRNERRQAVTLLSFSARGDLPNELALAKLLHATVQHQVDSTPGLISLTRSQSARLLEEQAMQGKNTIWGAAHLVEGSVSPADQPGMIKVALRLETLGEKQPSATIDAEAVGSIDDPMPVMTAAWNKLLLAAKGSLNAGNLTEMANAPPASIAKEEAKRLLREAEWLMAARMDRKNIQSLIESAFAMEAPHADLIRVHLDFLFRRIGSLSCKRIGHPDTAVPLHQFASNLRDLPVAMDLADRMAYELPLARELLHQASYYFTRHRDNLPHPRSRRDHHGNEFWLTINALSFMRAAIYEDLLTPEQRQEFEMLGTELDAFTEEYYAMLAETPNHDSGRSALLSRGHRWILKRNPKLYQGIFGSIHQVNKLRPFLPEGIDKHHGLTQFARDILNALEHDRSPKAELFKADIRCYLANADEAPSALRGFIAAAMNANRADWYELVFSTITASRMVNKNTPTIWFGECLNGGSMLPTLVHTPRQSPEAIRKADIYLNMQFYRSGLPNPMETRWYQIGSSEDWYDRAMQAALTRKDTACLGELLDAIRLHHMYSGHNHVPVLGKRYGNALEQATMPAAGETSISGTLLADLRNGTSSQTGCAYWFLRDQEDPGLLWIFYFASSGRSLGAGANGALFAHGQARSPKYRRTWLLGLDCRTGNIKTKVDLQQATLQAIGCNQPPADSGPWDMAIDQNKNAIMTNMMISHGRGNSGHGGHRRIIVIDKTSGTVRALPEKLEIADFTARETHAGWVNVAGLGDEFYFIDENGYRAATATNKRSGDRRAISIYRVGPDLKPTPLVEHGRRPAISPFDGPDTIPTEIAVDESRLLVYNGDKHYHFNAADMSWDLVKDHHTKFGFKMYHFAQRERQKSVGVIHQIQAQGQDAGWKIDFEKLKPDRFWCVNDTLGAAELRVNLVIPEDFRDGTTMVYGDYETSGDGSKSSHRVTKELSSGDYISKKPFHLVILNQTDDSLIVGMQSEPVLRWKRPSREGLHLPFLWKISKKDMLARLAKSASAGTNE